MHQVEKKVYNISNIGWIYAPFLEKGAYINELYASVNSTAQDSIFSKELFPYLHKELHIINKMFKFDTIVKHKCKTK